MNSAYVLYNSFVQLSYKCIGASDNIFDHFIFRSSLPTIPFNLVPIGSPDLLIRTQALSSNFTTLPSGLCHFFFVLTTTAWRISPRRTLFAAEVAMLGPGPDSAKFLCFWTTTMIRSPILACLFIFMTLVHSTTAAPELSMQLSIVFHRMSVYLAASTMESSQPLVVS